MPKHNAKILIVEDERLPAYYLSELLKSEGYTVVGIASNANDAIALAGKHRPDALFMDVMLKGSLSGCEAALYIRSKLPMVKILFLTAYIDEEMIAYASEAGACNYLLKPYNDAQILAALKLAIAAPHHKRAETLHPSLLHLCGEYFYDTHKQKLYQNTQVVPLRAKKHKLLYLLIKAEGKCIAYDELCEKIFGDKEHYSALRTLVSRLNHKLGFTLVENQPKKGYKITLTPQPPVS